MKEFWTQVLAVFIFTIFSIFLIGNNLHAEMGIIDDHEIAMFLGNDRKIDLIEIPKIILGTEIGQWGSSLRYRPSYYTIRIVETYLWRDHSKLWYGFRFFLLVFSLLLGWKIMSFYFPHIISYLFVFYSMTFSFWPDILTRLGPAEIYAIPGSLLFIYGLITSNLFSLVIGYTVSVGVKENFLILFPILITWMIVQIYRKKLSTKQLVVTMLLTIYTALIAGSIFIATGKVGRDIYSSQISYAQRIVDFIYGIPRIVYSNNLVPALLIMMGGTVFTLINFFNDKSRKIFKSNLFQLIFLMSGILIIIASQYIFYGNIFPSNTRYDYPVILLFPIFNLFSIKVLISILKNIYSEKIIILIYFAMSLALLFLINQRGYSLIQQQSKANSDSTQEFNRQLGNAIFILKNNPKANVVFVSDNTWYYEPIVSVDRYLISRNISNDFALAYTSINNSKNQLSSDLDNSLLNVMNYGSKNNDGFVNFKPITEMYEHCYNLIFGKATALNNCETIAIF